jgi:hydroxymethylpyrimidine/phosphomethylpyrimidine kinase
MPPLPCALTIAGSDSCGGAGIQADLKTFTALGVYGACVITALTAQNTLGINAIHKVPPEFVATQIDSVASDLKINATKVGMLLDADIIEVVAMKVKQYGLQPLIVDPVMVAGTGARLLMEEAIEALKRLLIPLTTILTPNAFEAEALTGIKVSSLSDARKAAIILHQLGASTVVVKGGHVEGDDAVDLIYDGIRFIETRSRRIMKGKLHGAGCVFSSAITANLAKGMDQIEAIRRAKRFVHHSIKASQPVGKGLIPVQPLF